MSLQRRLGRALVVAWRWFRRTRWAWGVLVIGAWILLWSLMKGDHTLALAGREHTDLHNEMTGWRNSLIAGRDDNLLMRFTGKIAEWALNAVDQLQRWLSKPAYPRPVPQIGWLGLLGIIMWVAHALAGWKYAVLSGSIMFVAAVMGLWSDSVDTLIVTMLAVICSVIIGLPIAVLIGTNDTANRIVGVILDLMQTMPTFVYLIPVVLFFGTGAPAAIVATLIYAVPPLIRVAGFGIRQVSETTIEATDSMGQTSWQRLLKVQLPMARRTIVVGLNQTTLAAFAMAVIASYVNGPGLGLQVVNALQIADIGRGLVPGIMLVLLAIMLDRTTTAASERPEKLARSGGGNRGLRWAGLGIGAVAVAVMIYLSRYYSWAATYPSTGWSSDLADAINKVASRVVGAIGGATEGFKNFITYGLLNPMQSVLAESPWFVSGAGILLLALVIGGFRTVSTTLAVVAWTVVCMAGLWYLDLWHDTMITLNMVLVATLLTMVLAVVFGVWMARRPTVDLLIRPLLDMGQTIPPFVYLVPVLYLFDQTRFTAIFAAIVYAAPVAIKLVADGVRGVPETTLEAGRSSGSTAWQEITKVQLPMARRSLVLAANQGLLYVLSMVVIGGMVGAGALGYDVVLGFSRFEEWGKGLAAGLSIVLLGIMLDRIFRAAAVTPAAAPTQRRSRRSSNESDGADEGAEPLLVG
ncbi:ABC transporter permease subunit [Nocardioides sp. JQ2195]|uniref:ABC transporter permease n=1 Tax=Nocardioides sp. JQ2195 TaxID=2592334 RepID=UPI001F0F94D8|nr:ABC transporter permease subunit [Nocardioides sp. JQ2195]